MHVPFLRSMCIRGDNTKMDVKERDIMTGNGFI